jgi:hypothetical protein
LEFGPFRGEQGFAVELGGQDLIFSGHEVSKIYSRSILVTDVEDAKQQLDKVCDRVDVVRGPPLGGEPADPLHDLQNVPSHWTTVLKATVWLVLGALYVWYAVTVRPSIPALLVGALAVSSAGVLAWQRLRRPIDRRFADIPQRIIVNYQTRDQWRQQRWNRKRDLWVGATSAILTAAVTVAATYWAVELTN